MTFWEWLEMLPLSARIGETWWFPLLESVHVLTAMFVVGSIAWVDLRLLGAAALLYPVSRFTREFLIWTWAAFAIALVSGFGMFMTGAGIKPGVSHGELDEIGFRAAVDRVSVHDLHATMLHLLGIDHKQLTYFHNGRRYRLTDVAGEVLTKILA